MQLSAYTTYSTDLDCKSALYPSITKTWINFGVGAFRSGTTGFGALERQLGESKECLIE